LNDCERLVVSVSPVAFDQLSLQLIKG
jgi:hypothetical protein